ncbi:dienelactone hydrolase family protein [Rhodospirillum sp. A1_3_36]|uniref:dienelactone hydrolase family protein n=1 Tax=Rhodospirillum sp. A1_3_36 TaxID=3391666 RepID=UPI0039A6286C
MGETTILTAADGHRFAAYVAEPQGQAKGGLVVVQEIFGLNPHIRDVCDRWAADGFLTCAPALFDRVERGVELDYDEKGMAQGRAIRTELGWELPLLDLTAAHQAVERAGKCGVIGFCWGGSLAWLAACRLGFSAASCYYGGQIGDFIEETPGCPVEMHFGRLDPLISTEVVAKIRAAEPPDTVIYDYEAGHGFVCDRRDNDFKPESAALAKERTLAFLTQALA